MKKIVFTILALALLGSIHANSGNGNIGKNDPVKSTSSASKVSSESSSLPVESSGELAIAGSNKISKDTSAYQKKAFTSASNVPLTVSGMEEDSLFFSSNEFYGEFDTLHIHSFNLSPDNFKDTTVILLSDEYNCGYTHPYNGMVSSGFGPRRRGYHFGIDIKLQTGDTVVSAFDGKVRIAKRSASYGNVIVIRHSNGLETYYAHLSQINVEIGQYVKAGQLIGLGGSTGHSTGSHLHFEVRFKGHPLNPGELISFSDNRLLSDKIAISRKNFEYLTEAKKYTRKVKTRKGKKHYRKGVRGKAVKKTGKGKTTLVVKNKKKPLPTSSLAKKAKPLAKKPSSKTHYAKSPSKKAVVHTNAKVKPTIARR